ncbi:MAG: hypothetical protein NTY53_10670 [Kiritimatiellaeota bacterium]|nr:hypothetical protein [Kiritimatiellota bacterium]
MKTRKSIAPETTPDFYSVQVQSAQRFLLDLRPRVEEDLTVISGGWERCAAHAREQDDIEFLHDSLDVSADR